MSALKDHVITRVACGKSHSLAVNEWGQLFAWGSNSMKQLGVDTAESQVSPKLVRTLGTKHVVQIALGNYHNLALTSGEYDQPIRIICELCLNESYIYLHFRR